MTITVGSMCTGYGGLEIALAALIPIEHAWHAELDPAAAAILAAHHPGTPNLGDITRITWADLATVPVLAAGWPCQPASLAGKRLGSADDRHLWPYVAASVQTLRPTLFVGENVQGILTVEHGHIFGQVLADLDQAGYTVSWTTVGACKVGACHHRHRVYIAATLAEARPPMTDPIAHRGGSAWLPAQAPLFGGHAALKWPAAGHVAGGVAWEMPASTCGANGVMLPTPKATDTGTPGRRAGEGFRPPLSQVILAETRWLPTPTATPYGNNQSPSEGAAVRPSLDGLVRMLPTPRATDATKGGPNQRGSSGDLMLPSACQPDRYGTYAAAVARQEAAFGSPAPEPTEPGPNGKPRLSPLLPEWMMGLPAGWITDHVTRGPAIARAGNGIVPQAAAYALPLLPAFQAAAAHLAAGPVPA